MAGIIAGAVFYLLMVLGRVVFGDDSLGEAAKSSVFEGLFYTVFMTIFFAWLAKSKRSSKRDLR